MKFHYVLLVIAFASPVWSNSTGAPKDACADLTPQHGVPPQSTAAPYSITTSASSVKAGDSVKILIKGNSDKDLIKGFLAQVQVNGKPVGTFTPGSNSQTLDCSGGKDSITHKKMPGDGVNDVTFNWNPPSDLKGAATLVATVAKNGETFWVKKVTTSLTLV